jgi:hypothetical protein
MGLMRFFFGAGCGAEFGVAFALSEVKWDGCCEVHFVSDCRRNIVKRFKYTKDEGYQLLQPLMTPISEL